MGILNFFSTLKVMNELCKTFNGLRHTMNRVDNLPLADDNVLDIFICAYIFRVGVMERIDKNDIRIQGPILVPAISDNNVSIEFAMSLIFKQLYN